MSCSLRHGCSSENCKFRLAKGVRLRALHNFFARRRKRYLLAIRFPTPTLTFQAHGASPKREPSIANGKTSRPHINTPSSDNKIKEMASKLTTTTTTMTVGDHNMTKKKETIRRTLGRLNPNCPWTSEDSEQDLEKIDRDDGLTLQDGQWFFFNAFVMITVVSIFVDILFGGLLLPASHHHAGPTGATQIFSTIGGVPIVHAFSVSPNYVSRRSTNPRAATYNKSPLLHNLHHRSTTRWVTTNPRPGISSTALFLEGTYVLVIVRRREKRGRSWPSGITMCILSFCLTFYYGVDFEGIPDVFYQTSMMSLFFALSLSSKLLLFLVHFHQQRLGREDDRR